MTVTVVVPAGVSLAVAGAQVRAVEFGPAFIEALQGASGPLVILSDGMDPGIEAGLAAAIRERRVVAVEVRALRWDGETPSPLSAACRGVISGFGLDGVRAAVRVLAATA